jgi:hypothetical protein
MIGLPNDGDVALKALCLKLYVLMAMVESSGLLSASDER